MDTIKLKELHDRGYSDRQIAKELGCSHKGVAYQRKKLSLSCNREARKGAEFVDLNHIKCSRCGEVKNLEHYQRGRKVSKQEYKYSYCNSCRRDHICRILSTNIDKYLEERYRRIKGRAQRENLDFTFSKEQWQAIYHKQNGLCFYTGKKMLVIHGKGSKPDTLSADRIDNSKGYVPDNVVFCCRRINTIKSNLTLEELKEFIPSWYEKIQKVLKCGPGMEF